MEKLSSKDVAKQLGVLPITVLRYIKRGKLKALRLGRDYIIAQKDVDEMLRKSTVNGDEQEVKSA